MSHLTSYRASAHERSLPATAEDFQQLFANQSTDLLRLSLLLTADAEKAESCVILAMRDCFFRRGVSKGRMHSWARRMVTRNAIRMVWGMPHDVLGNPGFEFHLQPSNSSLGALCESLAVLTLPDFDRLVLVICVLERYSILDCAILLGKAPLEVYEVIVRATSASPGYSRTLEGANWGEGHSCEG